MENTESFAVNDTELLNRVETKNESEEEKQNAKDVIQNTQNSKKQNKKIANKTKPRIHKKKDNNTQNNSDSSSLNIQSEVFHDMIRLSHSFNVLKFQNQRLLADNSRLVDINKQQKILVNYLQKCLDDYRTQMKQYAIKLKIYNNYISSQVGGRHFDKERSIFEFETTEYPSLNVMKDYFKNEQEILYRTCLNKVIERIRVMDVDGVESNGGYIEVPNYCRSHSSVVKGMNNQEQSQQMKNRKFARESVPLSYDLSDLIN